MDPGGLWVAGAGGRQLPSTLSPVLTPHLCPQISDAVYRIVYEQAKAHFEAVLSKLLLARPAMEAIIRTDMDQIITSKEHLASKIRGGQASRRDGLPRADLPGPPAPGARRPSRLCHGSICISRQRPDSLMLKKWNPKLSHCFSKLFPDTQTLKV